MRKRIIGQDPGKVSVAEPNWVDLERLAEVEVTSEDAGYPIESAPITCMGPGWRAAQPGGQTIRLLFDEPLRLRRIHLAFHAEEQQRTQEFVLRWSPDGSTRLRPDVITMDINLPGIDGYEGHSPDHGDQPHPHRHRQQQLRPPRRG